MIGVSVLVRPTGAIMWPPIVLTHLIVDRHNIGSLLRETMGIG